MHCALCRLVAGFAVAQRPANDVAVLPLVPHLSTQLRCALVLLHQGSLSGPAQARCLSTLALGLLLLVCCRV